MIKLGKTLTATGSTQEEYLGANSGLVPVIISTSDTFNYVKGGLDLIGKTVRTAGTTMDVTSVVNGKTQILTVSDGSNFRLEERLEITTSADVHKTVVIVKEILGNDLVIFNTDATLVDATDKIIIPEDAILEGLIVIDSRLFPIFLFSGAVDTKIVFESGLLGKR